jgi:hypothetical protein
MTLWVKLAAASLVVLPLVGCGTAEYEAKLEQTVKRLKIENRFVGLDTEETLIAALKNEQGTGAKISIRKPTFFAGSAFTTDTADRLNPGQPMKPERVKPPQLPEYPGFQFSYEQRQMTRGFGMAYAYFGAQATDPAVAEKIAADLAAAYPEATPPTWNTVQIDTPDGGSTPWKTISVSGPNVFWSDGGVQADNLPGTLVLWLREERGYQVLLGLRGSDSGIDLVELKRLMAAAAGTVRIATGVKIE